jgi:hypothetical protein
MAMAMVTVIEVRMVGLLERNGTSGNRQLALTLLVVAAFSQKTGSTFLHAAQEQFRHVWNRKSSISSWSANADHPLVSHRLQDFDQWFIRFRG